MQNLSICFTLNEFTRLRYLLDMTKSQRLITDFFKSKPKTSQKLITDFFKPSFEKKMYHYSAARDYPKSYKYLKKHRLSSDAIRIWGGSRKPQKFPYIFCSQPVFYEHQTPHIGFLFFYSRAAF